MKKNFKIYPLVLILLAILAISFTINKNTFKISITENPPLSAYDQIQNTISLINNFNNKDIVESKLSPKIKIKILNINSEGKVQQTQSVAYTLISNTQNKPYFPTTDGIIEISLDDIDPTTPYTFVENLDTEGLVIQREKDHLNITFAQQFINKLFGYKKIKAQIIFEDVIPTKIINNPDHPFDTFKNPSETGQKLDSYNIVKNTANIESYVSDDIDTISIYYLPRDQTKQNENFTQIISRLKDITNKQLNPNYWNKKEPLCEYLYQILNDQLNLDQTINFFCQQDPSTCDLYSTEIKQIRKNIDFSTFKNAIGIKKITICKFKTPSYNFLKKISSSILE